MNGMPMNDSQCMQERRKISFREASHLFSWLFSITQCNVRDVLYITVLCSVMALLTILVPSLIGRVIDGITNPAMSRMSLAILAFAHLAIFFLGNRQGFAIPRLTQRMAFSLRRTLHEKLMRMPVSYTDTHPHGDLMSRMTNDTESVVQSLSQVIPNMISSAVTLLGCLVIMLRMSPSISLINFGVGMIALLPCSILSRRIFQAAAEQQKALGQLSASATDLFSRRRSILMFDQADGAKQAVAKINASFTQKAERIQVLGSLMDPMMTMIGSCSFAITVLIGLQQIRSGILTIGMLQACLLYAREILRPFINVGQTLSQLQGCLASIERIKEILEIADAEDAGTISPLTAEIKGEIRFEHVDFSYVRGQELFKDLNVVIPAGKTTAIIGETGAGKTTLLSLLMCFYKPDRGQITVDGIPVQEWKRRRLYGSVDIILQNERTTAETVLESIAYGAPGTPMQEIDRATEQVCAENLICSLPSGLDTPLSEEGPLSAGQRQLISLARIPLSSARILIMDEATSSVDSYTEQKIQQAFDKLRKGRTCVVIAHRFSTIRNADHIIVMHHGRVVEQGTHDELIANRGYYHHISGKGEYTAI